MRYLADFVRAEWQRWDGVGQEGCGLIKAIPPREQSVVNSCIPQPPTFCHSQTPQKSPVASCRFHTEHSKQRFTWFKGITEYSSTVGHGHKSKGSWNISGINAIVAQVQQFCGGWQISSHLNSIKSSPPGSHQQGSQLTYGRD